MIDETEQESAELEIDIEPDEGEVEELDSEGGLEAAAPMEVPVPAAPSEFALRDGVILGVNPRDETSLGPIVCSTAEQVRATVAAAREAQRRWERLSIPARGRALLRFQGALLARGDELASLVRAETGKTEAEAWLHEVLPTADLGEYWSAVGPELLAESRPALDMVNYPGKSATIEKLPRGVIGLITPWNFPVAIPLRTIFPALLAGNSVVLKPSEHTPRCATIIAEVAARVLGPGLLGLVQGGGDVGAALIASQIDSVVFTGSVSTGRKVAHAAAEALIPVSLELGGKDAAIVLDDAILERTARGILWGAMCNSGQNCASVERVYMTRGISARLRERIVTLAKELKPGRDFGPLSTRAQLEIVEAQVSAARAGGAEILCGGHRLDQPGYWFEPTVISNVPADAAVLQDETFGPVVSLVTVDDAEAAVAAANDCRYGLTASVWTRDVARGEEVARRVNAGVVMVNNHGFTGAIPSLPWTGVGESGFGVTNSPHALDHLTRPRALIVDGKRGKTELWWYPYSEGLVRVARSMTRLKGPASALRKVGAAGGLVRGFLGRWRT